MEGGATTITTETTRVIKPQQMKDLNIHQHRLMKI